MLKDGEKGAILQRDKQSYAIVPHVPLGVITPDFLEKLLQVIKKFNVKAVKLTSATRIAIVGLKEEEIDEAWKILGVSPGSAVGSCVRSVKICPGNTFCRLGQQDSISLGAELDKLYHGMPLPSKFKIGVSGCINDCAEVCIKDLGFIGKPKGWTLMIGGSGGPRPALAKKLIENLSTQQALEITQKLITLYRENAKKGQRFGKFLETFGLENLKKELNI